ncbi:diguanylate cyclase domain-containing protein [Pseudothermotoga sp. U03pept]|uniref:diguanylate cyclase domain-containing protein n=1 Tax=Pseudothermotoga sp. U03pept TaxID=3447012 RepID=UPI003EFBE99F
MKRTSMRGGVLRSVFAFLVTGVVVKIFFDESQPQLFPTVVALIEFLSSFALMYFVFGFGHKIFKAGSSMFVYAKYLYFLGHFFTIATINIVVMVVETTSILLITTGLFLLFKDTFGGELWRLAFSDSLTGLLNRGAFLNSSRKILRNLAKDQRTAALIYIDLDRFKSVNDLHGHHVGDHMLEILSKRMKNSVREGDLLCRLGGDEFVILLVGASEKVAQEVVKRIVDSICRPVSFDGLALCVGVSAGIAMFPRDGTSIDDLVKKADKAMYKAKERNLGYLFVDQINQAD